MKKILFKNYPLNNFNNSYLLVKFPKYMITNTNYKEILILDNNLNKITTIRFPLQEILIHYTYYHPDKKQVLFQRGDDDSSMLLFNINTFKFTLIKVPQLQYGSPSSAYTWMNNQFYTIIGWDNKKLLEIDTSTLSVKLHPYEDRFKVAPELSKKIEIMERFHCNRNIPGTQFFGVLDYSNTKTIKIISFQGKLIRTISIENELDKELNGKVEPIIHAEKIPYEIRYQEGWFIIIWEKKIVVVSPRNNRITLYPKETRARFTKTTEEFAEFVLLTSDYSCKESSELQLYHVEDE